MRIGFSTVINDIFYKRQTIKKILFYRKFMICVGVVIPAAHIHGTDLKTILFKGQHVGHHSFLKMITKLLMSGSFNKFLRGYFSGADGSDKVITSSSVTLNHKSDVLEEIHIGFATTNTSDFFSNEKCYFKVVVFHQTLQADPYTIFVVCSKSFKSFILGTIAENDVLGLDSLKIS